jgi:hypothetical protein
VRSVALNAYTLAFLNAHQHLSHKTRLSIGNIAYQTSTMEELLEKVRDMWSLYETDEYMRSRLQRHITAILPSTLETEAKSAQERADRHDRLKCQREVFMEKFLSTNMIYFCPRSEEFIHYDGKQYNVYSEDNVLHDILTSIPGGSDLAPWKHRIKGQVMKKVKERSPLGSLPESGTIQRVVGYMCPSFFASRNRAKYFLTVLGDCVLGKAGERHFIGNASLKSLLKEVEDCLHLKFGSAASVSPIKLKYYDHSYDNCRILPIASGAPSTLPLEISRRVLDLICVAAHYSDRYQSSEDYLAQSHDLELQSVANFTRGRTSEDVVKQFVQDGLTQCEGASLTEANVLFVWKKYLDKLGVPDLVFKNTLLQMLRQHLVYDASAKVFEGVTSIHLPVVSSFNKFWAETMQSGSQAYEVDEVVSLFRKWNRKRSDALSPELAMEILQEMFAESYVKEDRQVVNVVSNMWDKRESVSEFFYVTLPSMEGAAGSPADIRSAYHTYSRVWRPDFIMGKTCFSAYAREVLGSHVDDDGMIEETFWQSLE